MIYHCYLHLYGWGAKLHSRQCLSCHQPKYHQLSNCSFTSSISNASLGPTVRWTYKRSWTGTTPRQKNYILCLPFHSETTCEDRLIETNLLPLIYWHEYLDMVFFLKTTNGHISLDEFTVCKKTKPDILTGFQQKLNSIAFEERTYRTWTCSKSHLGRATRIWNALPSEINCSTPLRTFKSKHKDYYYSAFHSAYNHDYHDLKKQFA